MGLEFWKLPPIILFGYGYIHFHIHICVKISYHILFFICLINSDTDNFHFHFGSDADVSDTNRHFLEYEYRIFRIIRYHFPPLILPLSFSSMLMCCVVLFRPILFGGLKNKLPIPTLLKNKPPPKYVDASKLTILDAPKNERDGFREKLRRGYLIF